MSTGLEHQIDRIVREVLNRVLRDPMGNGNGAPVPQATPTIPEKKSDILELGDRVVSLAAIEKRLEGVRQLVVPKGAVVTPAVRDVLRERKIELTWAVGTKPGRSSATVQLTIGCEAPKYQPAGLIQWLHRHGWEVEQLARTGLVGVTDELADQVARGGRRGLLLTHRTAAAGCLLNRHRGVRAVVVNDLETLRGAVEVAPNLLIVNPAGRSAYALQQLVQQWGQGASQPEPEYRDRLR